LRSEFQTLNGMRGRRIGSSPVVPEKALWAPVVYKRFRVGYNANKPPVSLMCSIQVSKNHPERSLQLSKRSFVRENLGGTCGREMVGARSGHQGAGPPRTFTNGAKARVIVSRSRNHRQGEPIANRGQQEDIRGNRGPFGFVRGSRRSDPMGFRRGPRTGGQETNPPSLGLEPNRTGRVSRIRGGNGTLGESHSAAWRARLTGSLRPFSRPCRSTRCRLVPLVLNQARTVAGMPFLSYCRRHGSGSREGTVFNIPS